MYAVEPFSLTAFAVYGSATEAIWSEPDFSSPTISLISALLAAEVTFSSPGALKTTRAVAPSALPPGKRSSSRSKARWASVPGIENELEVAVDAEAAPEGEPSHFVQECGHGGCTPGQVVEWKRA